MNQNEILNQIADVCKNYPEIERAALFGSRARGDCRTRSDFDVAVWMSNPARSALFRADLFEHVKTLLEIDVTVLSPDRQYDPTFLESIEKEKIIFYEKRRSQI